MHLRYWNILVCALVLGLMMHAGPANLRAGAPQDRLAEAKAILLNAQQLQSQNTRQSWLDAVTKYGQALAIFGEIKDQTGQAHSFFGRGLTYLNLELPDQALPDLESATPLFQSVGQPIFEANALSSIASIYSGRADHERSIQYNKQALTILRSVEAASHDPNEKRVAEVSEALALGGLAFSATERGEYTAALDYHQQAYTLFSSLSATVPMVITLNSIGSIYFGTGDVDTALSYHTRALDLARTLAAPNLVAGALKGLGGDYSYKGDKVKALALYREAEALENDGSNAVLQYRAEHATTLMMIAQTEDAVWEKDAAMRDFTASLVEMRQSGDRRGLGLVLSSFAAFYATIGDLENARRALVESITIYRTLGIPKYLATMLISFAPLLDRDHAIASLKEALGYLQNDPVGKAVAFNGLCTTYLDAGDAKTALGYCENALAIDRDIHHRFAEAMSLETLGRVQTALGRSTDALASYRSSASILEELKDRSALLHVYRGLAFLERDQNDLPNARRHLETAIGMIESQRGALSDQTQRSSYFATAQSSYQLYVDLLMRQHFEQPGQGHDREAFEVSERSRARVLLELLTETKADIRGGIEPELLARERSLQQLLDATALNQTQMLAGPHTDAQAAAMAESLDQKTTELNGLEAEIRRWSPNYAALTQPQPLKLKEIQKQVLDPDTLLLEYSLGPERSFLWAVTPDSIKTFQLPKQDEIEKAAREMYDLLSARNRRIKDETHEQKLERVAAADAGIPAASRALSQLILTPAAAELGKKRLVIVADGALQYIPFAALTDPAAASGAKAQPLIVDHEIVTLPSASTIAVIRQQIAGRTPAPKQVAALADPVFMKNDERLAASSQEVSVAPTAPTQPRAATNILATTSSPERIKDIELVETVDDTAATPAGGLVIPRLPGSRKESEAIVGMAAPGSSKLALGFAANLELAESSELSQYRYLHFSTHGFLNSVHPELSGLVFSMVNEKGEPVDGFLRAHEIYNLKLPAELVVLSACQTGIGKDVKGEGLVSLTRGFMYAGAARVVVSLWSVSDEGTGELMVRFYQSMFKAGLRPAKALKDAQVSLMKDPRWQSPYYWAPFILQGEWR